VTTVTTILGAGGPIGNELPKILAARNRSFRLVSRNPRPVAGGALFRANLADREQAIQAVAGSAVVHLLAGLKYNLGVWQELWPRIMANTIEACKRAEAKLIFFDNVYMYGKVAGLMTENTPYAPCSKKGEIRAKIATALMNEVQAGRLSAIIARSADFYGPDTQNCVPNVLVFEPPSSLPTEPKRPGSESHIGRQRRPLHFLVFW
jgi:nucleoside-diphosphate-sugar epimerase